MNLLSRFGGRVWDPWHEINHLQHAVNRLVQGNRAFEGARREFPPVNLYVKDDDLLLTLELPGAERESFDVSVTEDTVTITGELPARAAKEGESVHRRERSHGRFRRTLQLPFGIDSSRTEATYAKGVLTVKMSRPETQKPRKVTVQPA